MSPRGLKLVALKGRREVSGEALSGPGTLPPVDEQAVSPAPRALPRGKLAGSQKG